MLCGIACKSPLKKIFPASLAGEICSALNSPVVHSGGFLKIGLPPIKCHIVISHSQAANSQNFRFYIHVFEDPEMDTVHQCHSNIFEWNPSLTCAASEQSNQVVNKW